MPTFGTVGVVALAALSALSALAALAALAALRALRALALRVLLGCLVAWPTPLPAGRWRRDRPVAPAPLRHDAARFVIAPDAVPAPTPEADWRPVILPDRWQSHGGGAAGWYRIEFQVDRKHDEPWLVYLPRLREGGTLFLNGELLTRIAEPDDRTWVRWMRPHAVTMAPAQLRLGQNILHLRVNLGNRDRIVSTVHIGPDEQIRPRYQARYFMTYTMAQITIAVTTAVGVFVVAIWWRRRMELDYGLFGLGCLFWAGHTLNYVIETLPDPWWLWWRVLRYAATGGFGVTMTLFYLRHAGIRPRGMTRAFIGYWLSGPVLLAAGGAAVHPFVDRYYQGGLLIVGLVMIVAAGISVRQRRDGYNLALLGSALLGFGGSVHDYLLSQGRVVDPEGPYVLYLAAPALLATVGALLVDRFVRSLSAVEEANATLAQRVAARERELAATHERIRAHEREQVLVRERAADHAGHARRTRVAAADVAGRHRTRRARLDRPRADPARGDRRHAAVDRHALARSRRPARGAGQPALAPRAALSRRRHRPAVPARRHARRAGSAAEPRCRRCASCRRR